MSASPRRGAKFWVAIALLNAALAALVQWSAPLEPTNSDRNRYEYAGDHPFSPSCPPYAGLYCYRVLAPAIVEALPGDAWWRWRGYRWVTTTAAGVVVASISTSLAGSPLSAILTSILTQGSYGFAFTAYDPYSAEPAVFLLVALLAWCWLRDRWDLAFIVGVVGIFAKESVAAMSVATAMAALVGPRRSSWRLWVGQGVVIVALLLAYRFAMHAYLGWELFNSALAQTDLLGGGWIAVWLRSNAPSTNAFLLFATFGFSWLLAVVGFRRAPVSWRALALGSILPFLALAYVQNPDRALGSLFFVMFPLTSIALDASTPALAVSAAVLTAIITARTGTTTDWLPAAKYVFLPAAAAAMAVVWTARDRRQEIGAPASRLSVE